MDFDAKNTYIWNNTDVQDAHRDTDTHRGTDALDINAQKYFWCWNTLDSQIFQMIKIMLKYYMRITRCKRCKVFGKRFLEFNDEEAQDQVGVIQAQDVSEE